jgi:predicted HTH transcriptional regulator
MKVLEFLKREEGKTLEFKRDLSSPKNLMKTLVAFANTAGGRVIIGVEDKTRLPVGVERPSASPFSMTVSKSKTPASSCRA